MLARFLAVARHQRRNEASLEREMEALGAHLSRYPYLGLAHPVGRRIAQAVARAPQCVLEEALWYRARRPQGPERREAREMGPPEANWNEGRFNHQGQTVFYLASTAEGACAETAPLPRSILWVQRFRVRRLSGLLDLAGVVRPRAGRSRGAALLTAGLNAVMRTHKPDPGSPWKPEYFVPRFVADAARAAGFRGILYGSNKFEGYNAVLFAWTTREVRPDGEPEILEYRAPRRPR
jgi:RES domain